VPQFSQRRAGATASGTFVAGVAVVVVVVVVVGVTGAGSTSCMRAPFGCRLL
jgi:hypothetical protein